MADRRGWPETVRYRCFVTWGGRGNHNASRTRRLLCQDLPDEAPVPGASTIRHWAAQERWNDWAGDEAPAMPWQDPHQRRIWQTMWYRHVARRMEAALRAEHAILTGAFDGDLATGMKALAGMDQLLKDPALRALQRVIWRDLFSPAPAAPVVSLLPRERQAWLRLSRRTTR